MQPLRPPLALLLALGLSLLAPNVGAQTVVQEIGADGTAGQDGEAARGRGVELRMKGDPVNLEVRARGGVGGPSPPEGDLAGAGGDAALGTVYGSSGFGEVAVLGSAEAGRGGTGRAGAAAGEGGEVHLRDAVDGDTEGPLLLIQSATAGSAGIGSGGLGGAASSHLVREKSAESLELRAEANAGGRAAIVENGFFRGSDFGGPGAPARASARALNHAGPATALVLSGGGSGGIDADGGPAAPGGDAQAWATATTKGDGHAVQVGSPLPEPVPGQLQPLRAVALGGGGGSSVRIRGTLADPDSTSPADLPNVPGGDGGNASSFSLGVAHGRSPVEVYDTAIGGTAGTQLASTTGSKGIGRDEARGAGVGGEAHSVAIGLGGRGEPIRTLAHAVGGDASNIVELSPSPSTPFDPSNEPFVDRSGISNTFVRSEGPRPFDAYARTDVREGRNAFGRRDFIWVSDFGESGGAAQAKAQALGSGRVEVDARAEGGGGSAWLGTGPRLRHEGGPAYAVAAATGAGGAARALAGSNSLTTHVKVGAASEVVRAAKVEAKIDPDALDEATTPRRGRRRSHPERDATARAVVEPPRELTDAALAKAPEVLEALAETETPNRPALGRWTARQHQWTWGESVTTTLTLELRSERNLFDDPIESYRIALLSPKLSSWGFESLVVTLEKEGSRQVWPFYDAAEARDFLDGRVLEVGEIGGVELPFPSATFAEPANLTLSTGRQRVPVRTPGGSIQIDHDLIGFFTPRRSEVAVLTLELVTRRPGAGLELDFLVSTTPIAGPGLDLLVSNPVSIMIR